MRDLGADILATLMRELRPAVVFANADEAALASELGVDPAGAAVYVVKRGGDPVVVHVDGHRAEVPVERVADVLDSTGAGDAFAAGYIVAALGGASPHESARAGSVLAISALRRAGAL